MNGRRALGLLALLGLAACSLAANAWDRILLEQPPRVAGDFVARVLSEPDASGFWAAGRADEQGLLVRYDGDARVASAHYFAGDAYSVHGMPDGGALLQVVVGVDSWPPIGFACQLQRYDANGNLRWDVQTFVEYDFAVVSCNALAQDRSGDVWIQQVESGAWQRLADDGSVTAQFMPANPTYARAAIDPADAALYVPSTTGFDKYSAGGQFQWHADLAFTVQTIRVDADRNVTAFGADAGKHLAGAGFSTAGAPRWTRSYPDMPDEFVLEDSAAPDGGAYLATDTSSSDLRLIAISSNGAPAWPSPFDVPAQGCLTFSSSLATAANGDVLLLYVPPPYTCPDSSATLYHSRPDGSPVYALALPNNGLPYAESELRSLPDDSTLFASSDAMLWRVARDGSVVAGPPTHDLVQSPASTIGHALAPDGTTWFLVNDPASNTSVLSRFAANGEALWQHAASGFWPPLAIAANANRGCVLGNSAAGDTGSVACFSAVSGEPAWTSVLPHGLTGDSAARLLADGTLVAVAENTHLAFDAQGHVLHDAARAITTAPRRPRQPRHRPACGRCASGQLRGDPA